MTERTLKPGASLRYDKDDHELLGLKKGVNYEVVSMWVVPADKAGTGGSAGRCTLKGVDGVFDYNKFTWVL